MTPVSPMVLSPIAIDCIVLLLAIADAKIVKPCVDIACPDA